jgi:hypothetical protein
MENLEEMSPEDFEEFENDESNEENPLGIPIGSIFASIVPKKQAQNEEETTGNGRQKVKVDKKKAKKKAVLQLLRIRFSYLVVIKMGPEIIQRLDLKL